MVVAESSTQERARSEGVCMVLTRRSGRLLGDEEDRTRSGVCYEG